ncbi:hypothetical protein IWX49DRAFT_256713 [Phyllosticta citricarpa]|uniref:Uncharacterized protein n=2 Tax=Phyllosticta TaxID=121621 RepID=A0ABR1LN24_9PEZI
MSHAYLSGSLISNAPSIVQWNAASGEQRFVGDESSSPAILDVSYDEKLLCMYCRLRVAVKLKSSDKKVPMYHLLEPRHFLDLEVLNGFVPENVVSAFVHGDKCSSSEDIVGLRITLRSPGHIVGPKTATSPKTAASRKVLENLFSLGQSKGLITYLPSSSINATRLEHMRRRLLDGLLKFDSRIIDTLYAGEGGRRVNTLEDLAVPASVQNLDEKLENPPPYFEATSLEPPTLRRRKRQHGSPESPMDAAVCASAKKPREKSPLLSPKEAPQLTENREPWRQALAEHAAQFALLSEQVVALQKELHDRRQNTVDAATQTEEIQRSEAKSASQGTASTVEDGVEDRLEIAEREIAALRGAVCRIQESLPSQFDSIVHRAVQESTEAFDDRLAIELDDLRYEMDGNAKDDFEDQFLDIKVELRDFVSEEMKDIEENVKKNIKNAVRNAALDIDFDD